LAEACHFDLSLATGRGFIGEHVFARVGVALICFEDGKTELLRRIRAARIHYGIEKEELRGWLFIDALSRSDLKLALQQHQGLAEGGLGKALSRMIERRQLGALLLDPLVKTHGVAENDNSTMDFVATILAGLAVSHDIAIGAAHHTRKGTPDPGNADMGRGAGALKDAFRLCDTQTPMQKEEADRYCISDDERASVIRLDHGKVNPGDAIRMPAGFSWLASVSAIRTSFIRTATKCRPLSAGRRPTSLLAPAMRC
jgi:RecA-family ATPase